MENPTINILIATVSAVATLAAAIIYYYTLKEIRRQRQNTYMPQIFIDTTFFNVKSAVKNKIMIPSKWTEDRTDNTVENYHDDYSLNKFFIKCYNVGFGPATNVEIKYKFDVDLMIKNISKLQQSTDKTLKIDIEKKGHFISFTSQNKELPFNTKMIAIDNSLKDYISFVLPVNIDNNFSNIRMPYHILDLLNLFVFYFMESKKKSEYQDLIPPIYLEIKYKDIAKKQYLKKFILKINLFSMSVAGYAGELTVE